MGKKHVQPRFRAPLRRRARPGVCRWCRCSHVDPCPGGCGWADREQTLCTECRDVDAAWRARDVRPPNMGYAFFRGFMTGSDDIDRMSEATNPYPPGGTARYWQLGYDAGVEWLDAR